jgi:DNA recombination protein RmuC
VFGRLPTEWQVRDFRVGNRTVEFGLRLPNGLVLPIDSKWPATNLIEAFAVATDPAEQLRLKGQVEAAVQEKAREVRKYLDPNLTAGFGVAVLPDAVDELCGAIKADCLQLNVVLIGQSMLVPYLLLVFQTVLSASRDVDLEKLAAHLEVAEKNLAGLQEEVEGRLSRAITMLGNSRDDLRLNAARAGASLNAVRAGAAPGGALTEPRVVEPEAQLLLDG